MKKYALISLITCLTLLVVANHFIRPFEKKRPEFEALASKPSKRPHFLISPVPLSEGNASTANAPAAGTAKAPATAAGAPGSKADPRAIKEYLKDSGIEKEFYGLDEMLDGQIAAMIENSDLTPQEKDKIARIFKEQINGETLLQAYETELLETFSAEEIAELNKIAHDPIIEKVTDDIRLSDPSQLERQYSEYMNDLQANPPSKERQELVANLVSSSKYAEHMADVTISMAEELATHLEPGEPSPSKDEINSLRQAISEQARANIHDGMLFQVRDLSDQELKSFYDKKTSPVATKEEALRRKKSIEIIKNLFGQVGKEFKAIKK